MLRLLRDFTPDLLRVLVGWIPLDFERICLNLARPLSDLGPDLERVLVGFPVDLERVFLHPDLKPDLEQVLMG